MPGKTLNRILIDDGSAVGWVNELQFKHAAILAEIILPAYIRYLFGVTPTSRNEFRPDRQILWRAEETDPEEGIFSGRLMRRKSGAALAFHSAALAAPALRK
jgi:hypothetical protein